MSCGADSFGDGCMVAKIKGEKEICCCCGPSVKGEQDHHMILLNLI